MNLSRFFIDRPIFAGVLSVLTLLGGLISLNLLPISEYPEVVPPSVVVTANYPGANPKVIAETVATPLEEQINGVEGMLYMQSQATTDGRMTLTVTFKLGTDPDLAQQLVQNRVQQAERDRAAQQDQDGKDAGEDRPVDEEAGKIHCFTCGASAIPGRTRCKPLTTMRSPASRPEVTMRWPSTASPSVTSRQIALSSGPTTITKRLLWSVPIARSLTSSAGRALALPMRSFTNWPGIRLPSLLSNTARTRTVPLRVFTWLSMSCRRPVSFLPPFVTVSAST